MPITAPTKTTDFEGFLTPEQSAPIFDDAVRQSAFMQLFPRTPLGINGQKIPVVTSKPTANWVGEAQTKPTTSMGMGLVYISPKKLAAIAVTSAEVVRANPGGFTSRLRTELAGAFAAAFDLAVGYNLGGDGTGTGPFDDYLAATAMSVEVGTTAQSAGGVHGDLTAALSLLVASKKKLTGWALGDEFEPILWGATDTVGRPLYTELPTDAVSQTIARPGRLLNRPSFMGEGVAHGDTLGFGGNFQKGAWGAVGGISYRISTDATVPIDGTMTSLFADNLVAVLAEAEYGFCLAPDAGFVKLVEAAEPEPDPGGNGTTEGGA